MSRAVFICSIRFCRRDGALVSSTLPLTRIGRVVDLQHANGWIQSKQAVQATAIERVSIVAIIGAQLVQGIDPLLSCHMA
jgi:hypothetical protein